MLFGFTCNLFKMHLKMFLGLGKSQLFFELSLLWCPTLGIPCPSFLISSLPCKAWFCLDITQYQRLKIAWHYPMRLPCTRFPLNTYKSILEIYIYGRTLGFTLVGSCFDIKTCASLVAHTYRWYKNMVCLIQYLKVKRLFNQYIHFFYERKSFSNPQNLNMIFRWFH